MIDIDLLDERLVDALDDDLRGIRRGEPTPFPEPKPARRERAKPEPRLARPPKPAKAAKAAKAPKPAKAAKSAPAPVAAPGGDTDDIVVLLRHGRLAEVDHQIAMQAALALETGDARRRHDAATWATMRALLDGNQAKARAGVEQVRGLGTEAHDADTMDRYWTQRFWIAFEWGDEDEQLELLDHCRGRAYRYDDLEWRGPLTFALARLGRAEEARREFDVTYDQIRGSRRVDVLSMLAEAATLTGDLERSARVQRHLESEHAQLVVVGPGWVCIGDLARFQAHAASGMGAWALADQRFRTAADVHRELLAQPLLARTLREWGGSLTGRNDALAHRCLRESDELAARLGLTGLVMPTPQLAIGA